MDPQIARRIVEDTAFEMNEKLKMKFLQWSGKKPLRKKPNRAIEGKKLNLFANENIDSNKTNKETNNIG